jgi:PKD repeat protein
LVACNWLILLNYPLLWAENSGGRELKKRLPSVLFFVISLIVLVQVVQAINAFDYYAYGDSITSGEGVANESEVYISQMVATHDPTKTVNHNIDGSGEYSSWGLANFATHPGNPYPLNVYILFGMNDKHYGETAEFTYLNLEELYHEYTDNGSDTRILIETLAEDGQGDWSTYAIQRARIIDIQNYLDAKSIPYIKIYDAIDSIPGNCYPDEVNMSLMYNSRHPDTEGHRKMGEYIWAGTCSGTATGAPVARFTGNTISGIAPLTVKFTDKSASKLPLTFAWDFDDDGMPGSTAQNPSHIYSSPGIYTVSLTVTNTEGSDSEIKTDYITVKPVPIPVGKFIGVPTSGFVPLTVQFTDTSTNSPMLWNWTFGDGSLTNHTQQNPIHTYTKAGVYTVSLNVTNTYGSNTKTTENYIIVTEPPVALVANFTGTPTTGDAPLKVTFTDTSLGSLDGWNWSFRNVTGNNTQVWFSTEKNPTQIFGVGNYSIVLNASNSAEYSLSTQTTFINVTKARVNFTSTIGIYRNGLFYLRNSNSNGFADMTIGYGIATDIPLAGDWNGDGIDTIGVYRKGVFYLRNSNSNGFADITFGYGNLAGDTPVIGDWNGDGIDTVGVYRNGVFYLRNSNNNGIADLAFTYGQPGDIPLIGDWNRI